MKQIVNADLNNSPIIASSEKGIPIDTIAHTEGEKQLQQDVIMAMENNQEVIVSESDAEKSDENIKENVNEEIKPEESDEKIDEDNWDKTIDVEEETKKEIVKEGETEKKEEKPKDFDKEKIRAEFKQEIFDEFLEKYKPNEQKGENIRLHKQNEQLLREKQKEQGIDEYLAAERQKDIYSKFCNNHKDIISENSKKNLIAYQSTGDENLIVNDEVLSKLDSGLKKIVQINSENPLIDLEDRLETAYWFTFKDTILSNKEKQIQAKLEMEQQAREKLAEDGQKPTIKIETKNYTSEQQKVAEHWKVKLP